MARDQRILQALTFAYARHNPSRPLVRDVSRNVVAQPFNRVSGILAGRTHGIPGSTRSTSRDARDVSFAESAGGVADCLAEARSHARGRLAYVAGGIFAESAYYAAMPASTIPI